MYRSGIVQGDVKGGRTNMQSNPLSVGEGDSSMLGLIDNVQTLSHCLLENLPPELIGLVFSYLPLKQKRIFIYCKKYHEILFSYLTSYQISTRQLAHIPLNEFSVFLEKINLHALVIKSNMKTSEFLPYLRLMKSHQQLQKLERCEFRSTTLNMSLLLCILTSSPKIKSLRIMLAADLFVPKNIDKTKVPYLPELHTLYVYIDPVRIFRNEFTSSNLKAFHDILTAIITQAPKLQHVYILNQTTGMRQVVIPESLIQSLRLKHCLKSLSLGKSVASPEFLFNMISNFPNLEHLTLNDVDLVTNSKDFKPRMRKRRPVSQKIEVNDMMSKQLVHGFPQLLKQSLSSPNLWSNLQTNFYQSYPCPEQLTKRLKTLHFIDCNIQTIQLICEIYEQIDQVIIGTFRHSITCFLQKRFHIDCNNIDTITLRDGFRHPFESENMEDINRNIVQWVKFSKVKCLYLGFGGGELHLPYLQKELPNVIIETKKQSNEWRI